MKLQGGQATHHRQPLTEDYLVIFTQFNTEDDNNCLFLTIILCGFHALICFGELTQHDQFTLWYFVKTSLQTSLKIILNIFSFHLPYDKGNWFFEGNVGMIHFLPCADQCPITHMTQVYHASRFQVPLISWTLADFNRRCAYILMGCFMFVVFIESGHQRPLITIRQHNGSGTSRHQWWSYPDNGLLGFRNVPCIHPQTSHTTPCITP